MVYSERAKQLEAATERADSAAHILSLQLQAAQLNRRSSQTIAAYGFPTPEQIVYRCARGGFIDERLEVSRQHLQRLNQLLKSLQDSLSSAPSSGRVGGEGSSGGKHGRGSATAGGGTGAMALMPGGLGMRPRAFVSLALEHLQQWAVQQHASICNMEDVTKRGRDGSEFLQFLRSQQQRMEQGYPCTGIISSMTPATASARSVAPPRRGSSSTAGPGRSNSLTGRRPVAHFVEAVPKEVVRHHAVSAPAIPPGDAFFDAGRMGTGSTSSSHSPWSQVMWDSSPTVTDPAPGGAVYHVGRHASLEQVRTGYRVVLHGVGGAAWSRCVLVIACC
jgi:hypothetical protein